jgi:hypothetical protein
MEQEDPRGKLRCQVEVVRYDQQCAPFVSELLQELEELQSMLRIERARGLIEQQSRRVLRESPAQEGTLSFAAGQLAQPALGERFDLAPLHRQLHQLLIALAEPCKAPPPRIARCVQKLVHSPRAGTSKDCGTMASRRARSRTDKRRAFSSAWLPLSSIEPSTLAALVPPRARTRLLLPAPLGPRTQSSSPSLSSSETSRSASVPLG